MEEKKNDYSFFHQKKAAFSLERVICRLLAAWCCFIVFTLHKNPYYHNLEYEQSVSLSNVLLAVTLLFVVYSVVNIFLIEFESDTWFLLVGATICVLVWINRYTNPSTKFIFTLAIIVVYSLFVIYTVEKNELLFKKWNPKKGIIWGIAIGLGLLSGLVIGIIGCLRYLRFSAPNFDFGIFVNMFHRMKQLGLPLTTCERDVLMSHFGVHLSPVFYLLLPFYVLFPSPLTLQIGQAVVLSSGIVPVVLLCKHFNLSGKLTIGVSALYAFYPAISTGCFYDIHENCFLLPLLLWTFYSFEKEKYLGMYIFALLTFSVKEDAAVYILLFALFIIFSRKKYLHGSILVVSSLLYFFIAMSILKTNSAFYAEMYQNTTPNPGIGGPMINRYENLIFNATDGLIGAVKTAIVNPGYLLTQLVSTNDNSWGKIVYFIQIILPLGFIPFFTKKPSRWILIAPILLNLLTTYPYQYEIGFQYHFGISAFLIYAVILNLPDLKPDFAKHIITLSMAACCCLYASLVLPSLWDNIICYDIDKEQCKQMQIVLDKIPDDASVSCSTFLLPYLANRDEIYEIYYHGFEDDIDYVVIDARGTVDQKAIRSYLNQGYIIQEEHEEMLIVLVKNELFITYEE